MIERLGKLLLDCADDAGEVMSLSRLSRVARPRVLGRLAKVFERVGEIDQMIQADVGYRAKHAEVGIVALLCFQKVRERLGVPAIQISLLGPASIRAGFSFELGKANLVQDVAESLFVHLELPDDVSQQEIEVGVEAIDAPGKPVEPKFDTVARITHSISHPCAQGAQSAQSRFKRDMIIALAQCDSDRAWNGKLLIDQPRALLDGLLEACDRLAIADEVFPGLTAQID